MRKVFYFILLFFIIPEIFAQDYDLIVTTSDDSLACHIDSVTTTRIYLTMKVRNAWVNTYITAEEVKDYKYSALNKKDIFFEPGSSIIHARTMATGMHHTNMYLFSPSVFGIKQGDYYWSTYYLLIHDLQIGLTDRFTLRVGTDIVFVPLYLLPTYTIPISDRSAFAVGDLLLITGDIFVGNLLYGMYTYGNPNNNFTIGAGYWTSTISKLATSNGSPAFNLAAQFRVSDNVSFITENYGFSLYMDHFIWNNDLNYDEEYARKDKILFGLSGFKFTSRKNVRRSWQLSLLYVFCFNGDAPGKYSSPSWDKQGSGNIEFYPVPMIGYSIKFGKKYK